MIPPKDIAKDLGVAEEQVEEVLSMLKELEPQGLFASGLEECLLMQVRGMDEEELLVRHNKEPSPRHRGRKDQHDLAGLENLFSRGEKN